MTTNIYTEIYYPPINNIVGYSGSILTVIRRSRYLNLNILLE
ncbi:hypothetical protein [Nostoc sp. MS1]|nr:hypothetical protein [Nostoc sp. MS1]